MGADNVECVYSSEEQVTEMLPLSKEQATNPSEFGVVDNFRFARSHQNFVSVPGQVVQFSVNGE